MFKSYFERTIEQHEKMHGFFDTYEEKERFIKFQFIKAVAFMDDRLRDEIYAIAVDERWDELEFMWVYEQMHKERFGRDFYFKN